MSKAETLKIEYVDIDRIAPFENNPRIHPEKQIRMLVASISKSGFNNPLLVAPAKGGKHELIAGHGRVEAARRLSITSLPAIVLGHLNANERRAYCIADNAIMLKGEWSLDLLQSELAFQMDWDCEFNADAFGFEIGEADALIKGARREADANQEQPVEEPDRKEEAITKRGTLWNVGPHRILCGDALDEGCWSALMQNEKANVTISDMPFNVPIRGHVSGSGRHSEFAMASGEMSEDEFARFVSDALELQSRYAHDRSLSYQFIDWRSVELMIREGRRHYDALINLCVWVKSAAGMGSFLRSRHELICVFRKGKATHRNNVELGKHGRYRTNVWEYPGCTGFSAEREDNLAMHPTVKNIEMIADAIMDSTAHGDIVVDAFLGSGTTALAAQRAGRVCRGIEIDPHYCDLAVRRLVIALGEKAVDQDGRPFPA